MGLLNFVGRRAGKLVSFVWRILPTSLQLVWDVINLVYQNLLATIREWPTTARRKATEWRRKLMEQGIITQDYDVQVWWIFYILAYITLVAGWMIPPLVVMWFVGRIF